MESLEILENQLKLKIDQKLAFHLNDNNGNEYECIVMDIESLKKRISELKLKLGIIE